MRKLLLLVCGISFVIACSKDKSINELNILTQIPKGFDAVKYPADNLFSIERWRLGKALFYDKRLSNGNTLSCASCHKASNAFSDVVALSSGENGTIGSSNAPSLANVAYHPYLTRAGGVPTLEQQILIPIQEHNEFNTDMLLLIPELKADSFYAQQSRIAYNREFDAYVLVRAIANFERTLISGGSAVDEFNNGNANALTPSAQRGMQLFNSSKTNCAQCHSGFNYTNYSFANNGLYVKYADSGRMRFTKLEQDRDLFKVPSLRNVAYTAPYMHDGSLSTLAQVVAHYNKGGVNNKNKSNLIKPLNLTVQEQQDLVAFLQALSDPTFVNNKHFLP